MIHKASYLGYAVAVLVGLGGLLTPRLSPAHPLGNFSISHYTSLRLEPEAVAPHYIVDRAEIPTFQELQEAGMVPRERAGVRVPKLRKKPLTLFHRERGKKLPVKINLTLY